ncbi:hypothetical protein HDK64DRAFT_296943 [Phyllosticta capitalensis]
MALREDKATYLLFPIAARVQKCLQSFQELIHNLDVAFSDDVGGVSVSDVSDATNRFRIWAGNIGAHRMDKGSLDHRLGDASHIRDTSAILKGDRIPFEKLKFESDSDSDSSLGFDETANDEASGPSQKGTELGQLMNGIRQNITDLLRISIVVRKPAAHDRFAHFDQFPMSHFEEFDLRHIQHKFPEAPPGLVKRLARATSARRNYFKYREARQIDLSSGLEKLEIRETGDEIKSEATRSIVATSLNTIAKGMEDFKTENSGYTPSEAETIATSFASSFQGNEDTEEHDNTFKIPPFPEEGYGGAPFQCPICFSIVSVKTKNSWKKHVSTDLTPYVCTFESCSVPYRQFERRREWFEHELSHMSHWKCPESCDRLFDTENGLSEHLKEEHPHSHSGIERAREVKPNVTNGVDCPLCRKKSLPLSQLQQHLGEHQQQLALFALSPHLRQSDNEEGHDDDSEVSEQEEVEASEEELDSGPVADEHEITSTEMDLQSREIQSDVVEKIEDSGPNLAQNATIQFEDAVGRKFIFPWHICKTWEGAKDLINQAFPDRNVIGQHVREGHFDVMGPGGAIILPSVWETVIQPGWTVTMQMWPTDEVAPPPKLKPPTGDGLSDPSDSNYSAPHEEASRKKEEKKAPVKFKDAVGRKFSFPWHLCNTWKGMSELIKQAFLHVDVLGQHVHDGHYDLVGPDGDIILPQVWETVVQPGWTVTMHMWPMEEPEPPPMSPFPGGPPNFPMKHDWIQLGMPPQSGGATRKNVSSFIQRQSTEEPRKASIPPIVEEQDPEAVPLNEAAPETPKNSVGAPRSGILRWMARLQTRSGQSGKEKKK